MKLVKRTITISYDKQHVNMQTIINTILSLTGTQAVYPECERCQELVTALGKALNYLEQGVKLERSPFDKEAAMFKTLLNRYKEVKND